MTGTSLVALPGQEADFRLVRHQGHTVATEKEIPPVLPVRATHAGHVPCGHGDRLARGMPTVDKHCLFWAFSRKHQDVIIGMDLSLAPSREA